MRRALLVVAVIGLLAVPAARGSSYHIVFVLGVDGARGSDWLQELVVDLVTKLDRGDSYGLLVADADGRTFVEHDFGGTNLGSAGDLHAAIPTYVGASTTGDVDGLLGIEMALAAYAPGTVESLLVLVTDGAWVPWTDPPLVPGDLGSLDPWRLNAIVDHGFRDGSGSPAMGIHAGDAYLEAPGGEYVLSPGGEPIPGDGAAGVAESYLPLAESAWDIGAVGDSFRKAFVDVKIGELGGGEDQDPELDPGGGGKPPPPIPEIPEPSSALLVVAGAAVLLLARRRR
jgi:hypothetical protein